MPRAYCLEHEADLWQRLQGELWNTDEASYVRWFEGTDEFVEPGLPGRCGYFLGHQLVKRARKRLNLPWNALAARPPETFL